jgi:myosin heavy subunit
MPFACGQTKVFFKAGAQDRLEELRIGYFERSALTIQTWARKLAAMQVLNFTKAKVSKVQSFSRMVIHRAKFQQQKQAETLVAAWIRGCWCVATLKTLYRERAAAVIQARGRGFPLRRNFLRKVSAAIRIQRATRSFKNREAFRAELLTVVEQAKIDVKLVGLSGEAKAGGRKAAEIEE